MTRTATTVALSEQRFALSMPPSANNMFVNIRGRGRIKSVDYTRWIAEAGKMLMVQRPRTFAGPVSVAIEICSATKRRSDIDNKIKPIMDLLVTHQVIPDDNMEVVREINIKRVFEGAPCTVTVREA